MVSGLKKHVVSMEMMKNRRFYDVARKRSGDSSDRPRSGWFVATDNVSLEEATKFCDKKLEQLGET